MSRLQEPPPPTLPVICDFYFAQIGPPGSATYDGDTYPYPPLEPSDKGSDYRYAWGTTPVFLAVEFFGAVHEEREHVITPPGVSILEYFWDFGDGHTGYGPIVTHTYEVADPNMAISLTVLDSLGREFSTSKALSLVIVDFGYIYQRIRGRNTEHVAKEQTVESSGDFALTYDRASFIWISYEQKKVRYAADSALLKDSVIVTTSFIRKTTDKSITIDIAKTQTFFVRTTTDESLSTNVAFEPVVTRPKTYTELEALASTYENLESKYSTYDKLEIPLVI